MTRSNKARRPVILYGLIRDGIPVTRRFNAHGIVDRTHVEQQTRFLYLYT